MCDTYHDRSQTKMRSSPSTQPMASLNSNNAEPCSSTSSSTGKRKGSHSSLDYGTPPAFNTEAHAKLRNVN